MTVISAVTKPICNILLFFPKEESDVDECDPEDAVNQIMTTKPMRSLVTLEKAVEEVKKDRRAQWR